LVSLDWLITYKITPLCLCSYESRLAHPYGIAIQTTQVGRFLMRNLLSVLAILISLLNPSLAGAKDSPAEKAPLTDTPRVVAPTKKSKLVDINSASEADLIALPGVGEAYAKKIVAGRPYARKDQLKSRKIIPEGIYAKIKKLIAAESVN
jgi:competence protein ComEA